MRIALVHGAWADGSSWAAVIRRLQAAGHDVIAPQLSNTSLVDNVAKLRHVLTLVAEPTLVVGHSYGCQSITALGSDALNAVAAVHLAGFGLDEGESIGALFAQGPPTPAIAGVRLDEQGLAWLPEDTFLKHFAPDVDPVEARVMCAAQQPLAFSTLEDVMATPAWKTLPTWFAVAQHDEVIPPDAERFFAQRMGATTVELDSSHVVMLSHPDEVTALILSAVDAVEGSSASADSAPELPAEGVSRGDVAVTDNEVDRNLKGMDELDFRGWNTADWEGVFAQQHTSDVLVDVHGQPRTHGLGAHIDAMKALVATTGGTPIQVKSHPIRFGSGEWTCVVGEFESGGRMVTVAKWRDGAIAEEHIWL